MVCLCVFVCACVRVCVYLVNVVCRSYVPYVCARENVCLDQAHFLYSIMVVVLIVLLFECLVVVLPLCWLFFVCVVFLVKLCHFWFVAVLFLHTGVGQISSKQK